MQFAVDLEFNAGFKYMCLVVTYNFRNKKILVVHHVQPNLSTFLGSVFKKKY